MSSEVGPLLLASSSVMNPGHEQKKGIMIDFLLWVYFMDMDTLGKEPIAFLSLISPSIYINVSQSLMPEINSL